METKPGPKTSEFWVTVIVSLISFLNLINVWNYVPNKYSVMVMGAVSFAYAIARGIAKNGVKPDLP